jgi:hypothetical protein
MNSLQHHHRDLIRFGYSCFDRIICCGCLLPFVHTKKCGTIAWFLRSHRQVEQLNRACFTKISGAYHAWVERYAQEAGIDIVTPDRDVRREEWVQPYYQQLGPRPGVAVILKVREPERMVIAKGSQLAGSQLAVERRHVNLYYFYLQDAQCGRMFLRICPYFPFNLRVWLNGHNWLAQRLRLEGVAFEQRDNVFVDCAHPERLQQLSDAFAPADISTPVQAWLAQLLPFFSAAERQQGYRHQLFMTQMEYCHNLIFHQRAAVDRLFDRLMDVGRSLGRPDKLAIVFSRPRLKLDTRTGETLIKITKLRTPVLSSSFKSTSIKQYISNGVALRTESTSYQLQDVGIKKNLSNLPIVRKAFAAANQRYLDIQQDVLASYVDRGQLQQLRQPTVSTTGRRVPGLRVDDPRLLAVLQAITCFAYLAGRGCFRTRDLLIDVQKALGNPEYALGQLRYDLGKLRGKDLLVRLKGTQTYQLTSEGYRIALLYLKLYRRLYAPLTAAIRDPVRADNEVLTRRQTKLDRLYVAVDHALNRLADHLRLAA